MRRVVEDPLVLMFTHGVMLGVGFTVERITFLGCGMERYVFDATLSPVMFFGTVPFSMLSALEVDGDADTGHTLSRAVVYHPDEDTPRLVVLPGHADIIRRELCEVVVAAASLSYTDPKAVPLWAYDKPQTISAVFGANGYESGMPSEDVWRVALVGERKEYEECLEKTVSDSMRSPSTISMSCLKAMTTALRTLQSLNGKKLSLAEIRHMCLQS